MRRTMILLRRKVRAREGVEVNFQFSILNFQLLFQNHIFPNLRLIAPKSFYVHFDAFIPHLIPFDFLSLFLLLISQFS